MKVTFCKAWPIVWFKMFHTRSCQWAYWMVNNTKCHLPPNLVAVGLSSTDLWRMNTAQFSVSELKQATTGLEVELFRQFFSRSHHNKARRLHCNHPWCLQIIFSKAQNENFRMENRESIHNAKLSPEPRTPKRPEYLPGNDSPLPRTGCMSIVKNGICIPDVAAG